MQHALASVVASLPDGGEVREGQQRMAEAVAHALSTRRNLVVRAGTGTGKSLAYLIPSLLAGKRVVVATATKALQDQLAQHDLPLIEGHLEQPFEYAVLKGRSNSLPSAPRRGSRGRRAGSPGGIGDPHPRARSSSPRSVLAWAAVTTTETAPSSAIEPDDRLWAAFSVSPDECPGAFRCPSGSTCFAEAARAKAASADLVVTNLHLLGAHLASGDLVLPEFDALVVDEAHELEEVLSKSLGASLSPGRLRGIAAIAPGKSRGSSNWTGDVPRSTGSSRVATRFEDVLDACPEQRGQPRRVGDLADVVALVGSVLADLERALNSVVTASVEPPAKIARVLMSVGRLREQFNSLANLDEGSVAWIEARPRRSIEIAPIDVSAILSERVFAKVPVVLTSATVPPGLAERLGADVDSTDELDVGSPFAFEQQAMLYCAAHLPDRRDPASEAAIHDELAALIEAAGGRTLALFTSRRAMDLAVAALVRRLSPSFARPERGIEGAPHRGVHAVSLRPACLRRWGSGRGSMSLGRRSRSS